MKSKKMLHGVCMASAFISALLLFGLAEADSQWVQFRKDYYGYGGDYTEVVKADWTIGTLNFSGGALGTSRFFPIAVAKTYVLRNGAGTLTVKSTDNVEDTLFVAIHQSPFFYMEAGGMIDAWYGDGSSIPIALKDPQIKKFANHLFIQLQSQLVCPNETYNSPFVSASLAQKVDFIAGEIQSNVAIVYCPEGGFPIAQEAQFFHGVF